MNSCAKNGGAERRRFPAIGEKPEGGGVFKHPPPARRGLINLTYGEDHYLTAKGHGACQSIRIIDLNKYIGILLL